MKYVIDDTTLKEIANSIRAKTGLSSDITPENMPQLIDGIVGGEDLNDLLNTQEQLIAELKEELQDKASGGDGGDCYVVSNTDTPSSENTVADLEQVSISYPKATSIGGHAFYGCTSLVSIDLPNVTDIEDGAFWDCTALTSVNAPNLTSMGLSVFLVCTSLTSIDLPSVRGMGAYIFEDCTSLTSVNLPLVTSIGYQAFNGCTSLTSVNLPNATIIGENSFQYCTSLTSIDLPSATSIEQAAFLKCTSLASIDLPNVTSIGLAAIADCEVLPRVNLPSVTSIGQQAFYGCTSLDTLILGNTETVCNLDVTAIMGTKIATVNGEPTGEGFIYVPAIFYEQYVTNITEQAYMLLIYSGYSEEEAEYMAPYIAMAVLRTIEDTEQASTFGLRNPLANFKGFTKEAIEQFKQMRNRE